MKLEYRPDIDGLRAIAVISVVLYHAKFVLFGISLFSGGYLGVDIFFVISGYLITQKIFIEYKKSKNFNFLNFYERRIRRLLPALFIVAFASLIAAYLILLPVDLIRFVESIISQIIFLSNFNFWIYYHNGYMTESALMLPFLHTWSLSLEEQFYLIFPGAIFIILKYFKKYVVKILIFGLFTTLFLAHYSSLHYQSFTFYMLPFRAWEFLAGSILAYLKIFVNTEKMLNKKKYLRYFSNFSFLVILFYIFLFDGDYQHPSIFTSFLILSVSIIIFSNFKNNFVSGLLSSKILVYFGVISYSLYLWHYPIFSFSRHIFGNFFEEMIFLKLFLIALSIFLSHLTYTFVESKFRNLNFSFKKTNFFLVILLALILFPSWYISKNEGFPNKLLFTDYQKKTLHKGDYFERKKINLFEKNDKKNLLLVGNSHGNDLFNILSSNKILKKEYNFNYLSTQVHCLKSIVENNVNPCQRTFSKNENKMDLDISNFKNSNVVILKTKWYPQTLEKLDETLKFLIKNKKEIIIISDLPYFDKSKIKKTKPSNYNKNIQQKIFFNRSLPLERFILDNDRFPDKQELEKIKKIYYSIIDKTVIENNNFLKNKANKFNVKFLDHFSLICDSTKKTCLVSTPENEIIYKDSAGHIGKKGGEFLVKKIIRRNWFNGEEK